MAALPPPARLWRRRGTTSLARATLAASLIRVPLFWSPSPFTDARARANCYYFFNILQKLRTKVIKKNTNPEWSEELTLSIEDPAQLHILSGWYASPSVSFLPSFPESICLNLFTHTPSNLKKDIQIMHE